MDSQRAGLERCRHPGRHDAGIIPVCWSPSGEPASRARRHKYPAFDLETSTHDKVLGLASRIVRFLPNDTRHVVYGAVYSMNAEQFANVRATDPVVGGLRFSEYLNKVCSQLACRSRPYCCTLLAQTLVARRRTIVKPFEDGRAS